MYLNKLFSQKSPEPKVVTPTNEECVDWGDMMINDETFIKDFREPGRLASVHEKLMSPR